MQAWRSWPSLREVDRFEPWFDRILVNTCRNRLTRARRWRTTDISGEVALTAGDAFIQAADAFDQAAERDMIGMSMCHTAPSAPEM